VERDHLVFIQRSAEGWAAYFPVAGGVVTDLGGAMSHGALVSREVGIPCAVNTETDTRRICSGDWLRIDGTTGVVERRQAASPDPGGAGR